MLDSMAGYVDTVPRNKSTRLNPDHWRFLKKAMRREGGPGLDVPGTISSVFSPTYWASKTRSGHARTSVFGRSWFKRVWAIQEIAMSARAVVVCGRSSTRWTKLEKAYGVSEVWELWKDGQYLRTLIDMRASIQAGAREDLGRVMSKVSCFPATESLGRICAILGLAEELPRDLEIEIDYTADTSSKSVEATRAAGRQSRPGEPNVRFSSDGRLLFLHGIVVDEIIEVGPVFGNIQPGYRPKLHGTRLRIGDVQLPRGCSPCLNSSKRVADAVGPGSYPGTNETRRQAWMGFLTGIAILKDGVAGEERTRSLMRYKEALTRPHHILGRGPGELPWSKKTCSRDREMPRMADSMFASFELISTLMEFMSKRRVARTSQGYVGLCDRYTEAGDHLALVGGVCVPVVLRPASEHRWLLIGQSYVYGAMHGELWSAERAASLCVE
ncbi:hypothetical protein MAC_02809 [Metarhizium acridum CQMa 102]|uniref:Heterokaryon incompatibility domain-containing protein n=1 Tax=Metarhizium acridum (strain CQMa 102) TaxID=655827 RepID=E9DYW1_METAQ|nr:uncharacterized protein MAC_02809 [Metarhizium acridum CQMa 102]EFY91138.1 hypothetical protein MAC_02809 [Metarhizium acridum CQMa 102]